MTQYGRISAVGSLSALGALIVLYAAGVLVRQHYDIGVFITNHSGTTVSHVQVKVERRGRTYDLPDLAAGQTKRLFVKPVGESNIILIFTDSRGQLREEVLVGYVETGYCGNVKTAIQPDGRTNTKDGTSLAFCYGSWFDFFATNLNSGATVHIPPAKSSKGALA